jgi:ubiquinone/menaquinone biosynthesis C-methylase UbiE
VDEKMVEIVGDNYVKTYCRENLPDKVLEVGCNQGLQLHDILSYCRMLYGVDADPTAIHNAQAGFGNERLRFYNLDAISLPWSGNYFDLVYSCGGLFSYNEPAKAQQIVREMLRVGKHVLIMEFSGVLQMDGKTYKYSKAKQRTCERYQHKMKEMVDGVDGAVLSSETLYSVNKMCQYQLVHAGKSRSWETMRRG